MITPEKSKGWQSATLQNHSSKPGRHCFIATKFQTKTFSKESSVPKFAAKYEILRGVSPSSRKPCISQPTAKPVRVAFLLNERKFVESGGLIAHHDTLFLEDDSHDWDWVNGVFFYYGHAMGMEDVGDIVAVFAEEDRVVVVAQ